MTKLRTFAAQAADTAEALAALAADFEREPPAPRLLFAFYGCRHDDEQLRRALRQRFPEAALLGGSSSGGFITRDGLHGPDAIGLLCLEDDAGAVVAAPGPLGDDAAAGAEALLKQALDAAGCPGELPELVWVYQSPGREEAVLEGLRRVVGEHCPIIGGSAADDDVSGRWRVMGADACLSEGLAVGVLFPSSPIGFAFQGGYEPAGPSGIVTGIGYRSAGDSGVVTAVQGREILSIDGEPAAAVYNRWTGGALDARLDGGSILAETTMCPIATDAGRDGGGVAQFHLVHPESVTAQGGLRTFCNLEQGARVYAMRGDRQRLVERAGRVAAHARRELGATPPAGALLIYCGGCKMAVGDQIGEVAGAVAQSLGDAPFVGAFTFGEQGQLMGRNVHGNLMISAVCFGR